MKRLLFLAATLLLTAVSYGQTTLTEEEWNCIPPEVRVKINKMFTEIVAQARKQTANQKENGILMVEDGKYFSYEPEGSVFTQTARDRQAPPEGNYVFSRWSDMTDVKSTYISPELFRMTRKLPKLNIRNQQIDLSPIVTELKGVYLLDFARYRKGDVNVRYCRNTTREGLRRDIRDFLDKGHYITLMDMRQDGQYTRLYVATDGETVSGFVMVELDDSFDYGRFICLEGQIPQKDFDILIRKSLK